MKGDIDQHIKVPPSFVCRGRADNDIHTIADNDIHTIADNDIHIIADNDIHTIADNDIHSIADNDIHTIADNDINTIADNDIHTIVDVCNDHFVNIGSDLAKKIPVVDNISLDSFLENNDS